MSTVIDYQSHSLQNITIPSGKGIATNTNPSLPPINGSLATDPTTAGVVYVGNGAAWAEVSGSSGVEGVSETASQFSLTRSGQPSLTNCSIACQKISVGDVNLVTITLQINQQITVTGQGIWGSSVGTVPQDYVPPTIMYAPIIAYRDDTTTFYSTFFNIANNGVIGLYSLPTSGLSQFWTGSITYVVSA